MRIWFDVLTPKQVNFFKPLVDELKNSGSEVLCTGRGYRELSELAALKGLDLTFVGEHGGESLSGKLRASAQRTHQLAEIVHKFSPDALVSLVSPEASRVAFGLGIRHLTFCDAPHARAVCKLAIPLASVLMCPAIIPANEFTKYGISPKAMVRYRALDPEMWLRGGKSAYSHADLGLDRSRKTIVFRFEESDAAYLNGVDKSISYGMLGALEQFEDCNIVVLSRYAHQVENLRKKFGEKLTIMERVVDGTSLLMLSDVFIGSGGTMNWECALLGIPSVSYTPMKYHINEYLIRKRLIARCKSPAALPKIVRQMLYDRNYRERLMRKGRAELAGMQDLKKLTIKTLEKLVRASKA